MFTRAYRYCVHAVGLHV